jgi:Putative addiction module component
MIAGCLGGVVRSAHRRGICSAMNERVKKLSEEIRQLSPEEQADLMDELLVLTHGMPLPKSEKAWAEEIDRRITAVQRGNAPTLDARKAVRKYKKP